MPNRRIPVDKIIDGCANLAWLLSTGPRRLRTSRAAADYMRRHGLSTSLMPQRLYAAVEIGEDQRAASVVGVFGSAEDAEEYAKAVTWADCQVAPYWLHPFRE